MSSIGGDSPSDRRVDPHCGYTPANCPYGDACADCGLVDESPPTNPADVLHDEIADASSRKGN